MPSDAAGARPIISAEGISVSFPVGTNLFRKERAHAVDRVSLSLMPGQTLGLLGESGSGKSTLARLLLNLVKPDTGVVRFDGNDLATLSPAERRHLRKRMQMVFQDPYSSFDPSVPLLDSMKEPMRVHMQLDTKALHERIAEVVDAVGLSPRHLLQYPSQLSGGQLQRLAIARALTVEPDLIILDEPVSALDVSTQAQIINLLNSLQQSRNLAFLMISHDPSVVRHVSHQVGVMYLGQLVEVGSADEVFDRPRHPYTQMLLRAVLSGDPTKERSTKEARGAIASNINPPSGCYFHPRCSQRLEKCSAVEPEMFRSGDVTVHCHLYDGQHGSPDVRKSDDRLEPAGV